jgi:hypothetical protein
VLESTSFLLLWSALRELGPWLRSERRDFADGGGVVGGGVGWGSCPSYGDKAKTSVIIIIIEYLFIANHF